VAIKGLILLSLTIALAQMTLSWFLAKRWNFYSLVDVSWSYGIALISLALGLMGTGHGHRRFLFASFTLVWGVRLGTHLLTRLKKKFPEEDRRYQQIKLKWQSNTAKNFFWFFQFQALSQPLLCLPFLLAASSDAKLGLFDFLGIFLSLAGILGESLSDSQLKNFKSDPANSGQVCEAGLWHFSRHPNYFFEWLIWCGFACFGFSADLGYLSLSSPILMFLLLNFVTGVPPAEEQSLS
jgi:steroid 5-alpha reductase family enzyme